MFRVLLFRGRGAGFVKRVRADNVHISGSFGVNYALSPNEFCFCVCVFAFLHARQQFAHRYTSCCAKNKQPRGSCRRRALNR